jgi:hypothetical protein
MQRIKITELSQPVRSFLARIKKRRGAVVEDESGFARYGVIPYAAEAERAWKELEDVRREAAESMRRHGVTEQDVVEQILEDD